MDKPTTNSRRRIPLKEAVYKPPYDSPIEDIFAYNVVKYLMSDVELIPQYEVSTSRATFRLDFVLKNALGEKIAVECDGKEYHSYINDEWRDALILGESDIGEIFRFCGEDICFYLPVCLFSILKHHRFLFSQQGKINIITLAENINTEIEYIYSANHGFENDCIEFCCRNLLYDDERAVRNTTIIRRVKKSSQYWMQLYKFAKENNHLKNIEELQKAYAQSINI
jgi:hypothetical protein